MSTKVRLTDAESYPQHGIVDEQAIVTLSEPEVWARYRGTLIVIGAPEKPQAHWRCGTDVVFPVLGVGAIQAPERDAGLEPYGYVCRHQIQAGD